MRRPQFGLKTLLWLVLCVACFLGGRYIRLKGEDERLASQLSETIGLQRLLQTEQRMLQRAINARGNDADAAKADWDTGAVDVKSEDPRGKSPATESRTIGFDQLKRSSRSLAK